VRKKAARLPVSPETRALRKTIKRSLHGRTPKKPPPAIEPAVLDLHVQRARELQRTIDDLQRDIDKCPDAHASLRDSLIERRRHWCRNLDSIRLRLKQDGKDLDAELAREEPTARVSGQETAPSELPDLVTLRQAALAVHKTKRALEHYKKKNGDHRLPDPTREGGGGKTALWEWKVIAPWLKREFGVALPEHYSGNRAR
jgi:hypothetical protein